MPLNNVSSALLKSTEVHATRLVFNLLRTQQELVTVIPLLAEIQRNPRVRNRRVHYTLWGGEAQWREWTNGQRIVNYPWDKEFGGELKSWEYTEAISDTDRKFGDALYQPIERVPSILRGWTCLTQRNLLSPLESNETTQVTGQNLFDTEHQHLDGRGSFSNILDTPPGRVALGEPSAEESLAEFKSARERLTKNRSTAREIRIVGEEDRRRYTVLVRDSVTARAFEEILKEENRVVNGAAVKNRWTQSFTLLVVEPPEDAQNLYGRTTGLPYFVLDTQPGGPRPLIWLPVRAPRGLRFKPFNEFEDTEIQFGMSGWAGTVPAFPHVVTRVDPRQT